MSSHYIKIRKTNNLEEQRRNTPNGVRSQVKNDTAAEDEESKEWKSSTAKTKRARPHSGWTTTDRGWVVPQTFEQKRSKSRYVYVFREKRVCLSLKSTPLDIDRWAYLNIKPYCSDLRRYWWSIPRDFHLLDIASLCSITQTIWDWMNSQNSGIECCSVSDLVVYDKWNIRYWLLINSI